MTTRLSEKLSDIRGRAIAKGMSLMSEDEILEKRSERLKGGEMTTEDTCPYCGAPKAESDYSNPIMCRYECGTWVDLCARGATCYEQEIAKLKKEIISQAESNPLVSS